MGDHLALAFSYFTVESDYTVYISIRHHSITHYLIVHASPATI